MNENRVWKEFFLQDVVSIESGKRLTKADMQSGEIPFIGASEMNNGVTTFTGSRNESADFNVLGVNYNGSVGYSFYHPYEAIFSDDVKRVKWLDSTKNNKYTLLFLSSVIKKQKGKFAYGYKFNAQRMKRQKILLPINSEDEIDWAFIEKLMKRIESDILNKVLVYLNNQTETNQLFINKLTGGGKWSEFFIEEIAEIVSGKDIYERERTDGAIPYVTATAIRNGIGYFVGNSNETIESECLSVNRNGSVGYCFYHPYKALFGNDTRKLRPKTKSKYASLFISMCITKQKDKYGYGYKMGTERLKRQRVLLPIDDSGQPDWQFMEDYMRNMESRIILRYLERKNLFLEQ